MSYPDYDNPYAWEREAALDAQEAAVGYWPEDEPDTDDLILDMAGFTSPPVEAVSPEWEARYAHNIRLPYEQRDADMPF